MEGWIPKALGDGRYTVRGVSWRARDHVVLSAWDTRLAVPRGLLVLRPEARRDQPARARLVNAARLLTLVSHPQILRGFDLVPDTEVGAALVAESVDAVTLEHLLRDEGRLAPEFALRIAQDVLAGLMACHRTGVVHRSVDTDAVLVRKDGRALLNNFGHAQLVQATPEAVQVDLNGVAAILFKMCAGHDGGDLRSAAGDPDLGIWHGLPHAVAPIVLRGSHPVPSHQYATSQEMLTDLTVALGLTPKLAPPRRPAPIHPNK